MHCTLDKRLAGVFVAFLPTVGSSNGWEALTRPKSLPGIFSTKTDLSDGSTRIYWYHRASRKRLPGDYGTSEFLDAYQEATKVTARETETVADLIREYLLSPSFENNLVTRTKAEYRRMLSHMEAEFGTRPIKALESVKARGTFISYQERIAAKTP